MLGYLAIGLILLVFRFFYHILPRKGSGNNPIPAIKNDITNFFAYARQTFVSNPKIFRTVIILMAILTVLAIPPDTVLLTILETSLSMILYFLLAIVFLPSENSQSKGFPMEIFAFIYSVVFMFYSAGTSLFEIFFTTGFYTDYMWIYGDIITIISYVVCIATLRRFMERDLSTVEITLLGLMMMTTLEFITYYGVGFFNGIEWYDPKDFESNIFGDVTAIINQGIYLASQSQILERSPIQIWGYIILNGTDGLTITAVLGYLVQKFFGNLSK